MTRTWTVCRAKGTAQGAKSITEDAPMISSAGTSVLIRSARNSMVLKALLTCTSKSNTEEEIRQTEKR